MAEGSRRGVVKERPCMVLAAGLVKLGALGGKCEPDRRVESVVA